MIGEVLVDFIYPKSCLGCKKPGVFLCEECLKELSYGEQICPGCGELSEMGLVHGQCKDEHELDGLITVFDYQDERVRNVIDGIKFGFNKELIKILVESMEFELGEKFDLVTWIPLHRYRYNWRGFNQAEVLGRLMAERLKIKAEDLLIKTKNTTQQALAVDKKERKLNIEGSMKVKENLKIIGKQILLMDDVFTTGATMNEAARVLKKKGAKGIWGFGLAH